MKLSEHTIAVLKNFASINPGVVLEPGTSQKTISQDESIMVEAELEEITKNPFGVGDLNQLLGTLSTLKDPSVEFHDKFLVVSDDFVTIKYYAYSPQFIVTPGNIKRDLTDKENIFLLPKNTLQKMLKLASMNDLKHLSVRGENGSIKLIAHNRDVDTSSSVCSDVCDYVGSSFFETIQTANIKIIPDDYKVEIEPGKFARFTSQTQNLVYHIALELEDD